MDCLRGLGLRHGRVYVYVCLCRTLRQALFVSGVVCILFVYVSLQRFCELTTLAASPPPSTPSAPPQSTTPDGVPLHIDEARAPELA